MIVTVLRLVGAIVAGIVVVGILVVAVEYFSGIVHPFPEDFDGSISELREHVARYPHWVLAVAVVAWGFTALAGTWTAGRLGNRVSAAIVGLLLVAAVILNIAQLPYPIWFKTVILIVIPLAGAYGYRLSSRRAAEFARLPRRMPEGVARPIMRGIRRDQSAH